MGVSGWACPVGLSLFSVRKSELGDAGVVERKEVGRDMGQCWAVLPLPTLTRRKRLLSLLEHLLSSYLCASEACGIQPLTR